MAKIGNEAKLILKLAKERAFAALALEKELPGRDWDSFDRK